ncbi:hypothetical protein D3C72_2495760 [compost metagenome]
MVGNIHGFEALVKLGIEGPMGHGHFQIVQLVVNIYRPLPDLLQMLPLQLLLQTAGGDPVGAGADN